MAKEKFVERNRAIVEAYIDGTTVRDLAAQYDLSYKRVRDVVDRYKVRALRTQKPNKQLFADFPITW